MIVLDLSFALPKRASCRLTTVNQCRYQKITLLDPILGYLFIRSVLHGLVDGARADAGPEFLVEATTGFAIETAANGVNGRSGAGL